MLKDFIYTVKLVVQHKMLGTLDFILKDFEASIEVGENDYFTSFPLNSENILEKMNDEIKNFLIVKNYLREDIDFISYEVSTEDPYIDVYFSAEESKDTHNIKPQINVEIIPETYQPETPMNFMGLLVDNVTIEWMWKLVENCAYRMYDHTGKVIADIGVDVGNFVETGLTPGENYSRRLVAFNVNGESEPTEFVSILIPSNKEDSTSVRENYLGKISVKELEEVEEGIEQLPAFKSGIGDNLDLLVRPVEELAVNERFRFDIVLEGYRQERQRHYTAIPFNYKIVATGLQYIEGVVNTDVANKIIPWPVCNLNYNLKSYIYEPFTYTVEYKVFVKYDSVVPRPKPVISKPKLLGSDIVEMRTLGRVFPLSIESFSSSPCSEVMKIEADTFKEVITPEAMLIQLTEDDSVVDTGTISSDGTHDEITIGEIGVSSLYIENGSVSDELKYTIVGTGEMIPDPPPQPIYETVYKEIRYRAQFTIYKPEKDKLLVDLLEYAKSKDSAIASAPADSIKITAINLVECDRNVTLNVVNNKDVYATCTTNQNFYEFKKSENLTLSVENGLSVPLVRPSEVKLTNAYGNLYLGGKKPTTDITYTTISNGISVKDIFGNVNPTNITGSTPSLTIYFNEPKDYYVCSASLFEDEKAARIRFKDMFAKLSANEYSLQVTELSSRGPYKFYTDKTTTVTTNTQGRYIRIDNTETSYIEFLGLPGKALDSWTEESAILTGIVNGKEPMRNNEDGKKDFVSVAPFFNLDKEIINLEFEVVLLDTNNKLIDVKFRNQFDYGKTKVNGDVLVFSSDEIELVDTYGKWTGPVIRTEEWEITTTDTMRFYTNVFNPRFDYAVKNMAISDVRIKAKSLNPNVIVNCVNQDIIDFNSDEYYNKFKIPFLFEAKILSPSQNAWSPTINPGYYYINNDEYFLYANGKPSGINAIEYIPDTKNFYASIKAGIETKADPNAFTKVLNSRSSFAPGEKEMTIINDNGSISLVKTGGTIDLPSLAEKGYYTTEPLSFYQAVSLIKTTIQGSDTNNIKCFVSGEIGGIWTKWQEVKFNITANMGEDVDRFKIRFELNRISKTVPYSYTEVDKKKVDWTRKGYESTNMILDENLVVLLDNNSNGSYISNIFSIDETRIKTLKFSIDTNHGLDVGYEYRFYYATSPSEVGLQSDIAQWQEISTLLDVPVELQKYTRYKIEIPRGSKIAFNSVTKLFEGEAVKQISPIISSITLASDPPEWMFVGYVNKSILCSVPMDGEFHEVTKYSVMDTIYPDILASGITNPRIKTLQIDLVDEDVSINFNEDGSDKLIAKSLVENYIDIESKYIKIDSTGAGTLTPIPQLGRPIVAVHKDRGSLRHVTFFDEEGNMTLTNTETFIYDGRNAISLGYTHLDEKSIKIICEDEQEVPIKKIINNNIYFDTDFDTKVGNEIVVSYKLKDSFMVDYNYNLEANYSKIIVHLETDIIPEEISEIEVFYETDDYNDYYATELELNPLYNDISTGFIYLTHELNTPTDIKINMNPKVFNSNGIESAYMFIKVTDEIGNPVSDVAIQTTTAHGKILLTDNISNKFGVVIAKYFAPEYECEDTITAIIPELNVTNSMKVLIKNPKSRIFVTASSSDNTYVINEGEEITIEAKVFSEDLVPYMAQDMNLFVANYYGPSITDKKTTDSNGKSYFTFVPIVNNINDICRIEISCLGVKEYIDIKVVK